MSRIIEAEYPGPGCTKVQGMICVVRPSCKSHGPDVSTITGLKRNPHARKFCPPRSIYRGCRCGPEETVKADIIKVFCIVGVKLKICHEFAGRIVGTLRLNVGRQGGGCRAKPINDSILARCIKALV